MIIFLDCKIHLKSCIPQITLLMSAKSMEQQTDVYPVQMALIWIAVQTLKTQRSVLKLNAFQVIDFVLIILCIH